MTMTRYGPQPSVSERPEGRRASRPKDAATLILVKEDGDQPRLLMGQRHQAHAFMPNKYVFPGGRVSPGDNRITPATPLRPEVERKLRAHTKRHNVQALALAAIRETFEETGLLVGRPATTAPKRCTRSLEWRPFFACGVVPALDRLEFVARAITPATRSKRFDARFFLASADLIQGDLHDTSEASGELLELAWLTFAEARELDLPLITHFVLDHIEARYKKGGEAKGAPFIRFHRGRPQIDYL